MDEEEKRLAEELLFSEKKKPGFVKNVFLGEFDAEQVFPFPQPAQEEVKEVDILIDNLNAFAKENIDAESIDREAKIPDHVIRGLADLGVLGMTIPKEYGGLGMSQYAYCRTTETLARHCGSTALFVSVHQSIGLKALLLYGTTEQKQRWLRPLAKGEQYAAFALTEPNAGSDANGIETEAVFDAQKNVYRINGQKQWITNGSIAKILTVMAKTEVDTPHGPKKKVTAFLVTPDMPGFHVTAHSLEKVGMRGTWTANLAFKDLQVPADHVLGSLGEGLKICLTVLDYGRTTFGSICTGVAKELIQRAAEHARSRYQFKRPLCSFALVKKKLAVMHALTYAMEAATYLTAGFIDQNREDFMLESAILKVFASDALWMIIYETMQIFGGRSFFTDAPFERWMRDARLNMIGEGANEVLRAFIGVVGMRDAGVELKAIANSLRRPQQLWRFRHNLFRRFLAPNIPIRSPQLKREAAMLGRAIPRFSRAVVRLLGRYREEVIEKQLQLDRVASMAMAIYTTTAVLSKLDADLAAGGPNALGHDVAIGKSYCHDAMQTVKRLLKEIDHNQDQEREALSDQLTGLR